MAAEPSPTHHPVLPQPRDRHRTLTAALLLTSALISGNQKISRQRQDQITLNPPMPRHQTLTANRISSVDPKTTDNPAISNIDQLKMHARILDEDDVLKLGKENEVVERPFLRSCTQASDRDSVKPSKKLNRRKIVKGRPEMYVLMKRRKQMGNFPEDYPLSNITNQPADAAHRQSLLRLVSTKHNTFIQGEPPKDESGNGLRMRRTSLAQFCNIEQTQYMTRFQTGEEVGVGKLRKCSLASRRYSSANTIE